MISFSLYYANCIQLISSGMSSKILKEALIQQKEIQEEAEAQIPGASNFALLKEKTDTIQLDEDDLDQFNGFSETQSQYGGDEVNYLLFFCTFLSWYLFTRSSYLYFVCCRCCIHIKIVNWVLLCILYLVIIPRIVKLF